jgi:hypothetical protein
MNVKGHSDREIGQAALELAVLASLIILLFASLLTYGQRFGADQQIKMETFRKALSKSYARNSSVSYINRKDVHFSNIMGGYGEGQPSTVGASANVMWVKGTAGSYKTSGESSFLFYEINGKMIEDPANPGKGLPRYPKVVKDYSGHRSEVWAPLNIWKENIQRNSFFSASNRKRERNRLITNTDISDFGENVTVNLYSRFDKSESDPRMLTSLLYPVLPDYIYGGGRYNYLPEYRQSTIIPLPEQYVINDTSTSPARFGAYYNSAINRVEYGEGQEGTVIHRERQWSTRE